MLSACAQILLKICAGSIAYSAAFQIIIVLKHCPSVL